MTFQPDRKLITKQYLIILLVAALSIALMGGFGAAVAASEGGRPLDGFLLGGGVHLIWFIPAAASIPLYYKSIYYEIEEDEVLVRAGIITKSVKHVPYRTVTNIEVRRDPFDRLLGMGRLHIQTAGMSGQAGAEEVLTGLVDYDGIYNRVATSLRRYRGAMAPHQAGEEEPRIEHATLAAILEEVRDIRQQMATG